MVPRPMVIIMVIAVVLVVIVAILVIVVRSIMILVIGVIVVVVILPCRRGRGHYHRRPERKGSRYGQNKLDIHGMILSGVNIARKFRPPAFHFGTLDLNASQQTRSGPVHHRPRRPPRKCLPHHPPRSS